MKFTDKAPTQTSFLHRRNNFHVTFLRSRFKNRTGKFFISNLISICSLQIRAWVTYAMPATPAKLPSNKRRTQPEECSVYPSFISKYLGTTFKPTPVAVTNLSQQKSDTSKPFTNIPIFLFCIIFIYLCVYLFIYLVFITGSTGCKIYA